MRRVVRALEVYIKRGTPISVLQRRHPPPYTILQIGLSRRRDRLYERADQRIAAMVEEGLIEEVQGLLAAGVPADSEAMSGLGYRETVAFLSGALPSREALAAEIGRTTRRFIRTQANWFREGDPAIRWFDLDEMPYEEIEAAVAAWLHEGGAQRNSPGSE